MSYSSRSASVGTFFEPANVDKKEEPKRDDDEDDDLKRETTFPGAKRRLMALSISGIESHGSGMTSVPVVISN